jgi:hypothetical protein
LDLSHCEGIFLFNLMHATDSSRIIICLQEPWIPILLGIPIISASQTNVVHKYTRITVKIRFTFANYTTCLALMSM